MPQDETSPPKGPDSPPLHKVAPLVDPEAPPGMYLAQLGQSAHLGGLTGFMVVLYYQSELDEGDRAVETEVSGVRGADAYFGLRALGVRLDRDLFGGGPEDGDEVAG